MWAEMETPRRIHALFDVARRGERTLVMGILNVTPDSFSDGGLFLTCDQALRHAEHMVEDGADIVDIGGESTRPGSDPLTADEETARVLPVVEALASRLSVPLSIDTYKAAVARRAIEAGTEMVNDISGLTFDPAMAQTVADLD